MADLPGQMAFDFKPERREDRLPLPGCFAKWFWSCRQCRKLRPQQRPQRCPKCKQPSERVVAMPDDPFNPLPYDQAVERYRRAMAEDRRRWELLRAEDPSLPPYDDLP